MRQNKFRIWDKIYKSMFQVSDISWACDGSIVYINGYIAEDVILIQSTGLLDRNGKEIFDGDVVIVIYDDGFDEKLNVEWNNSKLRFILYNENNGNKYSFDSTLSERITVIGNIHEVSK